MAQKKKLSLRDAAYVIAINRVVNAVNCADGFKEPIPAVNNIILKERNNSGD